MQTGHPINYNDFAKSYGQTRWAVPWITEPLAREVNALPRGSLVIEIGCGTGNYIIALSEAVPDRQYKGFDLSEEKLGVDGKRPSSVYSTRDRSQETVRWRCRLCWTSCSQVSWFPICTLHVP